MGIDDAGHVQLALPDGHIGAGDGYRDGRPWHDATRDSRTSAGTVRHARFAQVRPQRHQFLRKLSICNKKL